jgi:hypothetical protein
MRELASPRGEGKRLVRKKLSPDEIVRRQRVHHLNRLFSLRYGGSAETWQFENDDAGFEDLKILAHHYCLNPWALPRIIKLRAPWADVEEILQEISEQPKRFTAKDLGVLVGLSGYEWRQYGIRTITPIDMSDDEIRNYIRVRRNGKRIKKRREAGMVTRAEYLEANNLSKTKPWEAERISRSTWERRRKKLDASLAQVKPTNEGDRPASATASLRLPKDMAVVASPTLRSPASLLALPDWSNHPMSALRFWSPDLNNPRGKRRDGR